MKKITEREYDLFVELETRARAFVEAMRRVATARDVKECHQFTAAIAAPKASFESALSDLADFRAIDP